MHKRGEQAIDDVFPKPSELIRGWEKPQPEFRGCRNKD